MPATYPPLLADINNDLGRFDPFQLFITAPEYGEQGQAADGQAILQFQPLSMDANGRIVPWDASEFGYASGTVTLTGQPADAETITINGVVLTFKTTAAAAADVQIGATFQDTAANLAAVINGTPDSVNDFTSMPVYGVEPLAGTGVTATVSGGVVTLHSVVPGTAGNAVTTTEAAANLTVGAATLAGGAAESDVVAKRPIGIAAQPVAAVTPGAMLPYWRDGVFNHAALVWPAAVATLAQRKRAFAGTPIGVGMIL